LASIFKNNFTKMGEKSPLIIFKKKKTPLARLEVGHSKPMQQGVCV
jgi:hypothetical protein